MYNLNILPPKLRKTHKKKVKIGNPTYAPFLLGAVFIVAYFLNQDISSKIEEVDSQIQQAQQQANQTSSQLNQIQSISTQVNDLRSEIQRIGSLLNGGDKQWAYILDEISSVTPPNTTLNSIEDTTDGIKLSATTLSLTSMAEMKAAMQKDGNFSDVDIADFKYQESNILNRPTEVTFIIIAKYTGAGNTTSDSQGVNQ